MYSQCFSPRTDTGAIGIHPHGELVLACRQVAIIALSFGKASDVLAINGYDEAKVGPKVCDAVNKHVT